MGYCKAANRLRCMNKRLIFHSIFIFFIFIFSVCALLNTTNSNTACFDTRCSSTGKANFYFQEIEKALENMNGEGKGGESLSMTRAWSRRTLSGLGSSPPRCISKCGTCKPCKPVHLSVPPGTPVTAEYYPEAWRCKCGNKLYMP